MEHFAKDIISVLQYLLPGFLAAWVFYGFTSFPKPSQFERVVQALIFTLIIQSIVFVEKSLTLRICCMFSIGDVAEKYDLFYSIITALILGATFSYFANNDKFHKQARN